MKQFKKAISLVSLVLALCMMLTACGTSLQEMIDLDDLSQQEQAAVTPNQKQVSILPSQLGITDKTSDRFITKYEEIARNSNMIMYADLEKGHFAVQNIETEKIWYSTPNDTELDKITTTTKRMDVRSQLIIHYQFKNEAKTAQSFKTENSQAGCIASGGIKTKLVDNGMKVEYTFRKSKIKVSVLYTLTNTAFKAEILMDEIVEPDDVYLGGINLLPSFGAAYNNTDGYMFIPDGSGALVDFKQHRNMAYSYNYYLYGEELAVMQEAQTLETQPMAIPVFGTKRGNDAIVGIITEGDEVGGIAAMFSSENCGYTAVSSMMWYRAIDCKKMYSKNGGINSTLYRVSDICGSEAPNFTVEYSLLSGENADYVGMAKTYRSWLEKQGVLEKVKEKPLFNLEVYGAAELTTSFLGFKYSKVEELTTVSQADEIVESLKSKGIEDIGLRYVGFGKSGILNNKISTTSKPLSSLGSTKELAALGEKVTLYPDYDMIRIRKGGNGISIADDILRTSYDYKGEQFTYSRSVFSRELSEDIIYILDGNAVLSSVRKLLKKYDKSGYKNLSVSGIGSILYSDFTPETGSYRDVTCKAFANALSEISNKTESLAIETASAYAFKYADRIWSAPIYSSGYDVFFADVPFYQLVLHGSVATTSPAVIQSGNPEAAILKAVETGSELLFGCTYDSSTVLLDSRFEALYSTEYNNWSDYAVEVYNKYKPIQDKIYDKQIISHKEVMDGVFVTEYENKVSVAVNYNEKDIVLPSGEKVSGKGFCELNGGAVNE